MTIEAVRHKQTALQSLRMEASKETQNERRGMKELSPNVCGRSRDEERHTTPSFRSRDGPDVLSCVASTSDSSSRRRDGGGKTSGGGGRRRAIASSPSSLNVRVALVPPPSWQQEIDGVTHTTPACLTPSVVDTHARTHACTRSRAHTHKHEKCWVTICERGIRLASTQLAGRSDKTPNMLPNGPSQTNEMRRPPPFFLDSFSSSTFVPR